MLSLLAIIALIVGTIIAATAVVLMTLLAGLSWFFALGGDVIVTIVALILVVKMLEWVDATYHDEGEDGYD